MVKSSDEFENGCIPMHWMESMEWHEDLWTYGPLLDNLGSATAACER